MDHSHSHSMTDSPLLPDWLRVAWAVLLCGVLALHAVHMWRMPGQRRWWHAAHTVMAAAMALMYLLPPMERPGPERAGSIVFAVAAVALVAVTFFLRRREGALNPLWAAVTLDTLAMAYMLLPMSAHSRAVSYVLAAYLAGAAVAWALGLWQRVPALSERVLPALPGQPREGPGAAGVTTGHPGMGVTLEGPRDVPITLAVMAASMAYMLAAM